MGPGRQRFRTGGKKRAKRKHVWGFLVCFLGVFSGFLRVFWGVSEVFIERLFGVCVKFYGVFSGFLMVVLGMFCSGDVLRFF